MRFLGLLKSNQANAAGQAASMSVLEKVGQLMDEATQAGAEAIAGLEDNLTIARVKLAAGQFSVTGERNPATADSRVSEASYAMFDVESIVEAILWTKCFLQVLGEGECEIRPVCAA
jgi:hypothetical protein